MKFSQKITLVGSATGIFALCLSLYYKLAHGELSLLLSLYTMRSPSGRTYAWFQDFFDCYAPSLAMAAFNGLVGFRDRSSASIMMTSAWMAVMVTAVHPAYLVLWGDPPFAQWWRYEFHQLYFFTVAPSFTSIFLISLVLWVFRRHLAGIPTD